MYGGEKREFRRGRKYRPIRNLISASITKSAIGVFKPRCSNERCDAVGRRAGFIVWCWVFFRAFCFYGFHIFFCQRVFKILRLHQSSCGPSTHCSLVLPLNSGTAGSQKNEQNLQWCLCLTRQAILSLLGY